MAVSFIDNYEFYGKCVCLSSNGIKLIATLDVGPRIVYYGNDTVNVMFQDKENSVHNDGEFFDTNFKKGESWKIYGGHRLWKSPEDMASYAPDNYPVDFRLLPCRENAIKLSCPVEKLTGLQKTIKIEMAEDGSVTLEHSFYNAKDEAVKCALWCLSVLDKGGRAIVPLNTANTGLLANRNLSLWSYTDIYDTRFSLKNDYFTLKQNKAMSNAFKIGLLNSCSKIGYYLKGTLFVKQYPCFEGEEYPDFSCNTELYTNAHILELETLSPLYTIPSRQTATYTENWSFIPSVEDDDQKLLSILR